MQQSTTAACQLSLPQLPITAREAHILPGLAHSSLLSIGKLCNAGCEAKFDDQEVVITKNNTSLLRGQRDRCTGLWRIPLTNNADHQMPQTGKQWNTTMHPAFLHTTSTTTLIQTWNAPRYATMHTNTTQFRN